MEIYPFEDDYVRMYSLGVETAYKGTSIVYDDRYKTLLYYYYTEHRRLYIIDGIEGDTFLPNVEEKVRIVTKFEDRQVNLFQKYLKSIIKNKKIYYLEDDFFRLVRLELVGKKPLFSNIKIIYNQFGSIMKG